MTDSPAAKRTRLTVTVMLQKHITHARNKGTKYVMIDRELAEEIVVELERIDAARAH